MWECSQVRQWGGFCKKFWIFGVDFKFGDRYACQSLDGDRKIDTTIGNLKNLRCLLTAQDYRWFWAQVVHLWDGKTALDQFFTGTFYFLLGLDIVDLNWSWERNDGSTGTRRSRSADYLEEFHGKGSKIYHTCYSRMRCSQLKSCHGEEMQQWRGKEKRPYPD